MALLHPPGAMFDECGRPNHPAGCCVRGYLDPGFKPFQDAAKLTFGHRLNADPEAFRHRQEVTALIHCPCGDETQISAVCRRWRKCH